MTGQGGATRARIIVSGILFWYPLAGVTYQFLHYLIGLRRLGYDVYYIEDSGRWVYDPTINDMTGDASRNVAAVAPLLADHGFEGRWAFRGNYPDGRCYGMDERTILRLYREADALLNVTAAQELRDEHLDIPRKIYVESDPFSAQARAAQGDEPTLATLRAHDVLFTFGENIGEAGCTLPTAGFQWHATRQPVVMDLWDVAPAPENAPFTTITTWHNKGKDLDYEGQRYYWTKDREFKRFLDLPSRRPETFELAVGSDTEAEELLDRHGWRRTDSVTISSDVKRYRHYIATSRGEFTVARDQYVRPRTGWFSDRSACYLAAGRPVITEETGFSTFLPTGQGLFGFSTIDDVVTAVEAVAANYPSHARAAREVAGDLFAAERVLGSLMGRAGL
ncbi:MAG: hypothetical protein M3N33_09595 [Actinomycetota bacterium]|nr:hypothetical protein [Actinomycetota bacterium]